MFFFVHSDTSVDKQVQRNAVAERLLREVQRITRINECDTSGSINFSQNTYKKYQNEAQLGAIS
ncbi:MAG: hypothetical protein B6247_13480 [Candidatus Parabeggiatoa sp. nov. 2]|nr:MAG: hypothetical protein B6247_13480 [Beggiatoa sp. 4572_84]